MNINLRKASVVQQTIQDEIKQLGTEKHTLSISLYETDLAGRLDEQLLKLRANNQKVGRLLEANRFFRATVARKNAEVGIADYLAEEAMLAAAEHRVKTIVDLEVRPDLTVLAQEIAARKENKDSSRNLYGQTYELTVNVATQELVDEAKRSLETIRKRRRKIKDEMVSVNVRTEFEVPEQIALVLTELGLD